MASSIFGQNETGGIAWRRENIGVKTSARTHMWDIRFVHIVHLVKLHTSKINLVLINPNTRHIHNITVSRTKARTWPYQSTRLANNPIHHSPLTITCSLFLFICHPATSSLSNRNFSGQIQSSQSLLPSQCSHEIDTIRPRRICYQSPPQIFM